MILIAALLIKVKHWKQYKYSSDEDSLIQLWSIYTVEYYVTIKKSKAILHVHYQSEESMVQNDVLNICYGFWNICYLPGTGKMYIVTMGIKKKINTFPLTF